MEQSSESPQTDAEYQVAIRAMLDEMQRASARMDRNQVEIDRLRAETRAMLDELPHLVSR